MKPPRREPGDIMGPEPTYEYTKGVGWQPKSWERIEVRMSDGVRVTLIMRTPVKGELYVSKTKGYDGYRVSDLRRKAHRTSFASLKPRHIRPNPDHDYCVVQRID